MISAAKCYWCRLGRQAHGLGFRCSDHDTTAALVSAPETREEQIARWEKMGLLVPNCAGCKEVYDSPGLPVDVRGPAHHASIGCKSGEQPHCSCSACF